MGLIPPWTDLPQELLSAIASFLNPNPIDILRFRTVCKSWHSSSPPLPSSLLSPLLPLTLPRPPSPILPPFPYLGYESCSLSATAVYALRPPSGSSGSGSGLTSSPNTWLIFVDQLYPNRKLSIRHPLSRRSFSLPLDFPRKFNLLDFRVSEIGRFYNLCKAWGAGESYWRNCLGAELLNVLFLSNLSVVVALSENGALGLLRLGEGKDVMTGAEWEIIHDGNGFRFDDIVEYKGRLFGIDRRARVYDMGHEFSEMNVIVPPITGGGGRRKRLVESCGILHLVVRCDVKGKPEKMGNIKVYQFLEKDRRWVEVRGISDQVLFFGDQFSISVSTKEFEGFCGKNCIMYEGYSFKKYGSNHGDPWLFYELGHGALNVGVYHLEGDGCIRAIESYPCYFDMLWPHPPWIWPSDKSRTLGTLEAAIDRLFLSIQFENLKAKYKELSSVVGALVGALVSMEGVSQISEQQIVTITKETSMLNRFMNAIDLVITTESENILLEKHAARRIQSDFTQLPNQIGTSEDIHGCVHFVQKATHSCTGECDRVSKEVNRRLNTLVRLSVVIRLVTENLLDFIEYLKFSLDYDEQPLLPSTSGDGNTKL